MTGFVIYSMGDPDFIRLALLGLSHAFEQGALSLAKIGLMLGLLAVFWQGVWNPGKIEFKQFFIGFFLVIILFGKSVPVTLIHGDGVGADAMPPIPIGIALGGTIATNFGHAMADSLRQFYHTAYVPGSAATGSYRAMIGANGGGGQVVPVAGNGLQPFRELMKLRFDGNLDAFTSTRARAAAASSAAGGVSINITKSIENYMSDCVLKDIYNQRNVQEVNEEAMRVSAWAWESMKVSYNGWTTSVNVDAGHGWKGVGCGTAYTKLTGALSTEWKLITETGGSTKGAANEALVNLGQTMLGSTNADAWKIKVNQVMMYHFKKAKTRSRWSSQAELMASQAEFEALDKRRISTGVQYSLWSEMAIPLMTYIEAFVFLIGPLMPFIVAFGEKGAGMVLKYFFLLIWVNTWPILQVGVNMYLQNSINKASFGSMTYDAFSWAGFNTSFTEIESFIAMGSTLQTMVPALSLMLLYGSVHTAINMSNSAQKGGGSEGAMATPKAAGSADSGKLSIGNSNYAHDANVGGNVNSYSGSNAAPIGMSQNNTKTDLSAATAQNIQAAKTQAAQASTASTQSITEMTNMMKVGSDGKSMQLTEGATRSQGMQRANAYADSLMKIEGMNAQDAKSLGLALSGGMGVKAQAEASAALGFTAKAGIGGTTGEDGKPTGGGKVDSAAKFGVGVKGEVSAQATSKLDTAISNVASLAEQIGNNWSFSNTEQGSAVLANAEQLSTSNATGDTAGFGKSGQDLEQSSKQWTDANSLVESESRSLSAINGFSGGTSYNLAGVTSDATQNRNDEKLADGSLLSTHARNTAFGSMNAEQKSDFDKFKNEGGYGKGLNGDIQALKDFSQTKEGASLAGMSSNFKTTQENAADYEKAIAADVGGDKSLQARREATGRYADAAFKNIMSTFGSERFEASAKFLDQLNANAGGKMANWAAAADDFRSMGNKAEQPLSMPAPQTAEQAGGPTAASVTGENKTLKADAQNFVAAKGAAVTATNPNATHAANVQTVTQQNQADPNKKQEATELAQKVDARLPKDGVVENLTQPLTQANKDAGAAIAPLGESVAGVASTLDNLVNGDAQEQAAAKLAQDGNVSTNTAALMTGGGSQTAHSEIVDRMKTGLSEDASPKERQAAIELMAASHAAGDQIESLRATGKAEDAKVADTLQNNVNSVNAALKASPFDDTQKEVLKGLGEKVANGDLSAKSANAGFEMMNNDKYNAAKTQHEASVATRGTSFQQLEINQRGGKAAMEVLESRGLINSEEYKSLQQKTQDNQNVLDSNVKSRAVLDAQEAYRQVDGNHVHMNESRPIANAIISSSINGSDYKGLKDASMNEAMKGDNQDNSKSFANYFKNSDDNIDAMKKYENVREGLVAASERLHSDPKMAQYGDKLDATIAKLDKQTGFDKRVAEPEPKPSTSPAGGQGPTGATHGTPGTQSTTRSDTGTNDNGQGNGDVNPPASNQSTVTAQNTDSSNGTTRTESGSNNVENQSTGGNQGSNQTTTSQSTVTAQNTAASNGTANSGSNENGESTGDNQATPSEGAVTTPSTDSNGTTRTESGSNNVENQSTGGNQGGNQTTTSQSTVTAQNTAASNGTANSGSNENGESTGDNQTTSSQSTVTAQNTDSSNGTTRTESGSNNVENQSTGGNQGGNQTTTSQSTVTAQNTAASNGTANSGSNENGESTGDNQATPSEGAVTTPSTDSNGTTRTESGSNNVENQSTGGNQGGNQTTTSQSTVTAQNTAASNGTANSGSNENGESTGDNQTTSSQSTVTAQNTDSSNGTTRTESGSNNVENQSTGGNQGGNQTTTSQSTVTAQNTAASNGTANSGSNENGESTGDNQTTSSQSTVTAQNTDSSNGTTRTESGSNNVENQSTGGNQGGNQTTTSQSTVTSQNTAASNGTANSGSNENGESTGDNQATPSEGAVTTPSTDSNGTTRTEAGSNENNVKGNGGTVAAQNTDSSNGSTSSTGGQGTGSDNSTTSDQSTSAAQSTDSSNGSTRTDTGSNETNVQGTGGENQTTSSQSTVATQSNVASNGSTNTDAGSKTTDGQGAGENQATTSEATVTTQSTDTFNGSTRTDAGTNEVTGNVSQSSAEQSTSASTGSENARGNPTDSSENNDSGNSVGRGDTGTNNVSNEQGATNNPSETVAKGDNSKPGNEDNNEPAAEGKASNEVSPSSEGVQSDPVTRSETGSNANAGSEDAQSSESAGSESTGDNTKPMTPESQRISSDYGEADRIKVSEEGFEQIQSAPEGTQMELGGETFTKVGGAENNGKQTSELMHNESGEHHNLYQDTRTGGGNLSIENYGSFSRA